MSRFAETEITVAAAGLWLGGLAVIDGLARSVDARRAAGWQAYHASRARNAHAAEQAVADAEQEASRIIRSSRLERALFAARRAAHSA